MSSNSIIVPPASSHRKTGTAASIITTKLPANSAYAMAISLISAMRYALFCSLLVLDVVFKLILTLFMYIPVRV